MDPSINICVHMYVVMCTLHKHSSQIQLRRTGLGATRFHEKMEHIRNKNREREWKERRGKLVLWSAISCLNFYWLLKHVRPAPHSRLLNGSDLVVSVMNPSALWYSRTHHSLRPPGLDRNDLSRHRHGTDKLTSCSIWPNFHIICGIYLTLFKWRVWVQEGH